VFLIYLFVQDKARKATGMQVDALQDGYVDSELFSLASVKVCFAVICCGVFKIIASSFPCVFQINEN